MNNNLRVPANHNTLLELRDRVEGENISVGFQWLRIFLSLNVILARVTQKIRPLQFVEAIGEPTAGRNDLQFSPCNFYKIY
ncbi:hypothetical protein WN51_10907 [Melipona quadrifasciata]|uniref:Uncharacterized protein n=1 Tax=Melipona quadrifasciata TaxID=166423 RepID=A0A0N0U6M7_9HYME|nr:hypothetical protein WN51_10907 [Melipona quadrifasciata]